MSPGDVCGALEAHVRRFFKGRAIEALTWAHGPIQEQNPHFCVLRVAPSKTVGLWTYVSIGGWTSAGPHARGTEFVLCTDHETPRAVELLAMTVFYNRNGRLGLGHTLPLGEPWLGDSLCDHFVISSPYPFGPELEVAHVGERHVDFLWLLPITEPERQHKVSHGLESLESRFEEVGLRYWDVERDSVVP